MDVWPTAVCIIATFATLTWVAWEVIFPTGWLVADEETSDRLDAVDQDIDRCAAQGVFDYDAPVGYAHADRLAQLGAER